MKRSIQLLLGVGLLAAATSSVYAQDNCDRACLGTMLDQYLKAVVSHKPESAPLALGVRQTENAINVSPGYGVWQSVSALGPVQRQYFDPVSQQAAYYGSVVENKEEVLVTVRIKVDNKKITEAEWYIARANDPGLGGNRQPGKPPANLMNTEYLKKNGPPIRTVPANERSDRDTLIRVVNSYFDALTSHDRTVAMAHPGCGRAENGTPAPAGQFLPPIPAANSAATTAPAASTQSPADPAANDCLAGLKNFNLSMVAALRIPLVDVEAQAVLAYAVFIRRPGSPTPRNVFSEWFFIDQAKIRTVYTAMFYPSAELAVPNWPPFGGNWPLPASTVPTPAP